MSRTKNTGRRLAAILLTMLLAVSTVTMNLTNARATTLSNPRTDSNGVVTWDCVYFGNYPQSDATGQTKEPIKWRVLSVNGNDAFLVADQNLDCQQYNTTYTDTTWETCTMRSWLNGYDSSSNTNGVDYSTDNFIDRAFTASEQNAIFTTTLENADNPYYGTEGGNNTDDKVFLLSYDDVTNTEYGFSSDYSDYDKGRRMKNSNYAEKKSGANNSGWWLRSPGYYSRNAVYVYRDGYVDRDGDDENCDNAVCPALHLNLSSSNLWSYAGTVSSEGNSTGGENPPSGEEETLSNPRIDSDGVVTWDCVYFGNYPQSDATGETKDPIKWRVLSVNGNDAFLVADQNLDCQNYNVNMMGSVTWETCTIRSWLNGYNSSGNFNGIDFSTDNFIDRAFTVSEQNAILTTTLETEGGNNTDDKVFLLSYDDVTNTEYGFSLDFSHDRDCACDKAKRRKNSNYVKEKGAYTSSREEYFGNGKWWLRSPTSNSRNVIIVRHNGDFGNKDEASGYTAVCPALHLNLSSSNLWSYAGTVSSDVSSTEGENLPSGAEDTLSNPRIDSDGGVTWDCVYFGHYRQSDELCLAKPDRIKWRVLSVDGNDAFLVADQNLDCQKYDVDMEPVTWETCTMRSWLNGYGSSSNTDGVDYSTDNFIDRAFTAFEQNAILTTTLENADDPIDGAEGGNNTDDKVFLLSYDDVTNTEYGFSTDYIDGYNVDDKARRRRNSNYANDRGARNYNVVGGVISGYWQPGNSTWWLRSPSGDPDEARCVCHGSVSLARVDDGEIAVCPALHLDLSYSNLWSYAGTVSIEGNSTGGENPPSGGEETPSGGEETPSVEEDTPSEGTTENPQKENPADNSANTLNSQTPQTQQSSGNNSQTTGKQMIALKLSGISKKIAAGKKIKLSPAITPIDATDQTLTWTSSNPKYATVSQQGVVTTKKKGAGKSVTITATARDGSGITASCKIKIVKDAVKSIKLKAVSKSVKAGKKITVKATVKTSGKTANKTLQWSSSNIKYATVSKKGVVTTKKAGKGKTVKITAMATDGTGKKAAITFKIQ